MQSFFIPCLLAAWLGASFSLAAGEITVFAAASLSDALQEIGKNYTQTHRETVRFNFAASNILARQIHAGAPADLFISADQAQMDELVKAQLVVEGTREDLLGNTLVVITPKGGLKITTPADLKLPAVRHLSLGNPQAVPAGIYAKAWLEKIKIWDDLKGRVVPAENVRAALAVVESGNAEAGIVYKTDAAISKKITVAFAVPPADSPAITYPAAVLIDSRKQATAGKFLNYLSEPAADAIFIKFGFSVID